MELNLTNFVISYLATAAWVTVDSGENDEFTDEAKERAEKDCVEFIQAVREEFGEVKGLELLNTGGKDLEFKAAHDFFLTRNHHGAGFWDSPDVYGGQDTADKLTAISERIGEVDCYHVDGVDSKLTMD